MNKKFLMFLFFIPFVCLFCWTTWLYMQRETGKEVTVTISGYDPRDLLSGHYISFTIDWDKTDCTQFPDDICPKSEFCTETAWGRQCRFYIPEENAEKLNNLFLWRNSTGKVFEIVYSYHKGSEPLAKRLLINGTDWYKALNE